MFNPKKAAAAAVVGACVLAVLPSHSASKQQLERGRYLVVRASMCIDCHSPMDAKGNPDPARAMQGAPTMFKPIVKVPAWAETAPALAGLVGYTDAQIVRALTAGIGPTGNPLRPPMPPFRFDKADAEAIAAYLRTLKPAPKR
ncbi:MAG: cytochrome c [Bryobacteraceae bacterium]|nr:cytochrome c [Bryobacteraceae bacterium]